VVRIAISTGRQAQPVFLTTLYETETNLCNGKTVEGAAVPVPKDARAILEQRARLALCHVWPPALADKGQRKLRAHARSDVIVLEIRPDLVNVAQKTAAMEPGRGKLEKVTGQAV
jgi:hypothetical protein